MGLWAGFSAYILRRDLPEIWVSQHLAMRGWLLGTAEFIAKSDRKAALVFARRVPALEKRSYPIPEFTVIRVISLLRQLDQLESRFRVWSPSVARALASNRRFAVSGEVKDLECPESFARLIEQGVETTFMKALENVGAADTEGWKVVLDCKETILKTYDKDLDAMEAVIQALPGRARLIDEAIAALGSAESAALGSVRMEILKTSLAKENADYVENVLRNVPAVMANLETAERELSDQDKDLTALFLRNRSWILSHAFSWNDPEYPKKARETLLAIDKKFQESLALVRGSKDAFREMRLFAIQHGFSTHDSHFPEQLRRAWYEWSGLLDFLPKPY
jgi:hypothetical protein